MVTSVTNLSRSGLYDWMAQRVSAVVLAAYFIFLIGYLVANPGIGETLEGGKRGSKIVIAVSVVVIVLAGVWIW